MTPTETPNNRKAERLILARVAPQDFVGRREELRQITSLAAGDAKSLLVWAAPASGASEFLRQAFDALFDQRGPSPVYFNFARSDFTAQAAARRFLHTFLLHHIVYRRNDPSLIAASPTMRELMDLSDPNDYVWIGSLINSYERARASGDEKETLRLCFDAPRRAAARGGRTLVLLDDVHIIGQLKDWIELRAEITQMIGRSGVSVVLCGLRRQLSVVLQDNAVVNRSAPVKQLRLKHLSEEKTHTLLRLLATKLKVDLSEETRGLIARQFNGNLSFLTSFMQAARSREVALTSFRECQKLYVDELLGGRIGRRYDSIISEAASSEAERLNLIRVLHESAANVGGKTPLEVLRRRAEIEAEHLSRALACLHAHEVVNLNATYVELAGDTAWRDFLQANYRLRVTAEPRARVVAETLVEAMKRAPQIGARHVRRESVRTLRRLLGDFNFQRVPASLLHFDRFKREYVKIPIEEIPVRLSAETDLIRLPQIINTAGCASFYPSMPLACEEDQCLVAHGFDAVPYTEANEVVWITADISAKIETGRALAEVWCDRLAQIAQACGFSKARLWLISGEGFTAGASEVLNGRGVFSSDRRQLESLAAQLSPEFSPEFNPEFSPESKEEPPTATAAMTDEFEMVIQMGGDTELIASPIIEQIARRLDFQPEEINQIKTALVEACINVVGRSHDADGKIHQHFQSGRDKLVVTVASGGRTAAGEKLLSGGGLSSDTTVANAAITSRRAWSLKLIRTLMDKVEFEQADDETRLRMTKYRRQ